MAQVTDVFRVLSGVPAAARASVRHALEAGDRETPVNPPERTLLYGAGWAGVIVAGSARQDLEAGFVPVGFLDDDRRLQGSRAAGLPILGDVSDMATARRRTRATSVLITLPYSSGAEVCRVVDAAIREGLSVRTVPSVTELLDGTIDARQARPLRMEDLLRAPTTAPTPSLQMLVKDSTVMVTGAGGELGSQLVRRLTALRPRRLAVVDETEPGLRALADELQSVQQVAQGSTLVDAHVVDVADRDVIGALVRRIAPSLILHVSTLPETPDRDRSAAHATLVNLGGTSRLMEAAIEGCVERFVLVSADEVLERPGVIGLSLRLAEMVVCDIAQRAGRAFTTVRTGPLARTSEDAGEALRHQLRGGGLLTVNASELRRSAMTVAGASQLILEAAAMAEPGSTYRLDPGTPRRAGDVTRDLIRLLGADPDLVPIRVIGRPPREVRVHQVEAAPTAVPRVMRARIARRLPVTAKVDVERLLTLARAGQDDLLRTELTRYLGYLDSTVTPYLDESGLRPAVPVPIASPTSDRDQSPLGSGRSRARPGMLTRPSVRVESAR